MNTSVLLHVLQLHVLELVVRVVVVVLNESLRSQQSSDPGSHLVVKEFEQLPSRLKLLGSSFRSHSFSQDWSRADQLQIPKERDEEGSCLVEDRCMVKTVQRSRIRQSH